MTKLISLSLGEARPLAPNQKPSGHRRAKMKMVKLNMTTGNMIRQPGEVVDPPSMTLVQIRDTWNSLVPAAEARGIFGVRVRSSTHETLADGRERLAWLRAQLAEHGEDDTDEDNVIRIGPVEETKSVILDALQVRNFYPRKGDRVGTRILFRNGSALAVTDTFEQVEAAIREALAA